MRNSGPRALTRARRRSARDCLGACPRATCAFPQRNNLVFQTLTTRATTRADVSRAFHPPRLVRRREFVELKERYESCMLGDEGPLLDVRAPVRAAAASFMSKVADGASAGGVRGDADEGSLDMATRAQTALDAMSWIESAMEKIDWGKLRREELSSEELCDAAYALGNVVRLWKECAPMIEGLMTSDEAKALRRRDAFLTLLSQAKKLRYPDRSAYGALDARARHRAGSTESGEDYFLTWLPEEYWHDLRDGAPQAPPVPSPRCRREHVVEVASTWQKIQTSLLMARLGSELFDDIVPTLTDESLSEDDLAGRLRLARSILLSGKAKRCATIGRYEDLEDDGADW